MHRIPLYHRRSSILFAFLPVLLILLLQCAGHKEDTSSKPPGAFIDSLYSKAEGLVGMDSDLARLYLHQARSNGRGSRLEELRYHMIMGRLHYYDDAYVQSVQELDSALILLRAENNERYRARTLFFQASSLHLMGNIPAAMSRNLEAIEIFRAIGNNIALARSMNLQAVLNLQQGDGESAMDWVLRAAEITAQDSSSIQHALVLSTCGRVHQHAGRLGEAETCIRRAYEIRCRNTNIRHMASSLIQLAELEKELGDYTSGLLCLEEAESVFGELSDKVGLFNVYYLRALMYQGLGEVSRAWEAAHRAEEKAELVNSPALGADINNLLYQLAKEADDFRLALHYHELYREQQMSLLSLENQKNIARIEYEKALESELHENQILVERDRNRRQQVLLQLLIITVLLVCLAGLLVVLRLRRRNNRNRQALLEKEKQILENDLEVRNKELAGKTMELMHQNETMQSIAGRIEMLGDKESRREIESILDELKGKNRQYIWDEFHAAFNHVHGDFYGRLFDINPDLSASEIKVAALLRLNLSTKEIAAISYKSESAVKTSRHRLRQKLKLEKSEQLVPFLMKL